MFLTIITFFSFFLIYAFVLYTITFSFSNFEENTYSEKEDLSTKYIRPGLNVDNLPIVKVDYGKYKPEQNVNNEEESTNDVEKEQNVSIRRNICLTRGYYLGKKNEYVNCAEFCGISSNDEVQYKYIIDAEKIINGREKSEPGAWCIPKEAATCNTNTSLVVFSLNGWYCLPRTDAFAGEGGNRIVVCNGSLYDNALNTQYDNFIPSNLIFNDVYNDKLSNGNYRFVCPPNLEDDIRNRYIISPLNRLHIMRNSCLENIPFGKNGSLPDFETGNCICQSPYSVDPDTGKCTSCNIGFNAYNYTFHLRNQICFSINDYTTFLASIKNSLKNKNEIIRPCGIDYSGTANSEITRPRCLINEVSIYPNIMPSNNTLNYIKKFVQN